MAKSDYLQTIKNRSVTSNSSRPFRERKRYQGIESRRFILHGTSEQFECIRSAMRQELQVFNAIVDAVNPVLSRNPELLSTFTEQHIELFGVLAEYGLKATSRTALPEKNRNIQDFLVGLSESVRILFESAAVPGRIHPETRKSIAREVLKMYIAEAKSKLKPVSLNSDLQYQNSGHFVETVDIIQKRHVQLKKSTLRLKFNELTRQTEIFTPYHRDPFLIDADLVGSEEVKDENGKVIKDREYPACHFNLCMIHQEPGQMPRTNDPFVIELFTAGTDYLVRFLDQPNVRASAFHTERSMQKASGRK